MLETDCADDVDDDVVADAGSVVVDAVESDFDTLKLLSGVVEVMLVLNCGPSVVISVCCASASSEMSKVLSAFAEEGFEAALSSSVTISIISMNTMTMHISESTVTTFLYLMSILLSPLFLFLY